MGIANTKLAIQTTAITDNDNNFPGLLRKGYMIARYLKEEEIKIDLYVIFSSRYKIIKGSPHILKL